MNDPLGMLRAGTGGSNPLGVGKLPGAGSTPAGGVPTNPNGASFKDVLLNNLNEVNKLQQEATTAIEGLQTGERDVEGVLLATQKADTAFRMLVSLRNKVEQAYDEVKQMRV